MCSSANSSSGQSWEWQIVNRTLRCLSLRVIYDIHNVCVCTPPPEIVSPYAATSCFMMTRFADNCFVVTDTRGIGFRLCFTWRRTDPFWLRFTIKSLDLFLVYLGLYNNTCGCHRFYIFILWTYSGLYRPPAYQLFWWNMNINYL